MERKKVRSIQLSSPVRHTQVPGKPEIIEDNGLLEIVRSIMSRYAESGVIPMKKNIFKDVVYDLVIRELRIRGQFYKNLNFNIIWKQVSLLLSQYHFLDFSADRESLIAEYDDLCYRKANKLDYDHNRLNKLKESLS